jgi:hypothetical protein
LQQSGIVSLDVVQRLRNFHHPELRNHQGTLVGEIGPNFQLKNHA